jgi:hypothetical protein
MQLMPGRLVPERVELVRERLVWWDPDGIEWDLTGDINDPDGALVADWGITGLGAPPRKLVTKPLPAGGVQVTHLNIDAGQIAIPLHIVHPTQQGFYALRDRLRAALHPTRSGRPAPGALVYTRVDGTARQLEAICTAAPEDRDIDKSGPTGQPWQATVLEFLAPDPYWSDVTPLRVEFTPPLASSFLGRFWTVSPQRVRGDTQVVNDGQVDAYPIWSITGPADSVHIANVSTGGAFTFQRRLGEGEQILIDTGRGRQAVRSADGANRMAALDWPAASLWALIPGANDVRIQMANPGPGAAVVVEFRRRYEGP